MIGNELHGEDGSENGSDEEGSMPPTADGQLGKYAGLGISTLFPQNWKAEENLEARTVTIESPQGAFIAISKLDDPGQLEGALKQVRETMEEEYDEVEQEPFKRVLADVELIGITQRFAYLDLIVTSHLTTFVAGEGVYLVQIQAEDRDMDRLQAVFDAMLTSILRPSISV